MRITIFPILGLLALLLAVAPVSAQTPTPSPTATIKYCHTCGRGGFLNPKPTSTPASMCNACSINATLRANGIYSPVSTTTPQPPTVVVHMVLFWMDGCPHCHAVLENVLPPLQERYGSQLEILLVEVRTTDEVDRLYGIAASYGISSERVGVPFLIIGDHLLIGSVQIPAELPGLIETYLATGGVALPEIPGLEAYSSQIWPPAQNPQSSFEGANVHVLLFSTPECHACQLITGQASKLVREQYAEQVSLEMIEIATNEDVDYLYHVAAGYGLPEEQVDLPLLIVGNHVLIGEAIPSGLPTLIESYLQAGGAERPSIPPRTSFTDATTDEMRDNGFTLAMVTLVFMAAALIYSLISFAMGKTFHLPKWADWLIPALIVIGIGVASYLSYVETQSVEAMCGPVGDCNAVQQSRYAKLFDVFPVGVLGLLGYLALFATWLARRFIPKLENSAALAFLAMAFFAVIFSFYLTYLEPFVIKAVCIWCLTSSVIVAMLLLLGLPAALNPFTQSKTE